MGETDGKTVGKIGFCRDKPTAFGPVFQRIVLLTQKELGDLIVVTPLIRALKQNYPQSQIVIASRPVAREVYAGNPAISAFSDILLTDVKRGFFLSRVWAFFKYAARIRRLRADIMLQLEANDVMALWSFFSGARTRIGVQKQTFRGVFTGHNTLAEGAQSALLFYLGFLSPLGVKPAGEKTELFAGKTLRAQADGILIHPGARLRERLWPAQSWLEFIRKLHSKYPKLKIKIIRSPFDAEISDSLFQLLSGNKHIQWVAVADFAGLCDAMRGAKLAITMDSAPRHVAAACGVPTVSLMADWILKDWGIYDEKKHRVVCSHTPRPDYGIATIKPRSVLAAVNEIWPQVGR